MKYAQLPIYTSPKSFRIKQLTKNGTIIFSADIENPYDNMFDDKGNKKQSIIYVAKIPYKEKATSIEVFNGSKLMKSFLLKN